MKPRTLAIILFIAVAALTLMLVARSAHEQIPVTQPADPIPTAPVTTAASSIPPPTGSAATSPLAGPVPTRALPSPHATVVAQLALLEKGSDADFRRTFAPSVQTELTSEAIARCREWMRGRTVKPHWAMAEESTEEGTRVVRVSMFGKSLTGFHESPSGQWLADTVWCLPPGP